VGFAVQEDELWVKLSPLKRAPGRAAYMSASPLASRVLPGATGRGPDIRLRSLIAAERVATQAWQCFFPLLSGVQSLHASSSAIVPRGRTLGRQLTAAC